MRPRIVLVVLAALAAVGLPACLLTTNLSELSGGDADGGGSPTESGTDATDSPSADSPASADAGDASRPFHCADQPSVFCADFEADPYDMGFMPVTDMGGTLSAATGRFGRGLSSQIPNRTASDARPNAALLAALPLKANDSFTLAYDLLVEDPVGAGVLDYGGYHYNGPFYSVSIRTDTDGAAYLHEYADPYLSYPVLNRNRTLTHGLIPGRWTHVVLKVTQEGSASFLRITFDGETVFDTAPIDAYKYASAPKIPVGIDNAEDIGKPVRMLVDDVIVTSP